MSKMKSISVWMRNSWRPAAAYVYLIICLCDFMVMPLYYAGIANKNANIANVELAMKFEGGSAQVEALKTIRQTAIWSPITLQATGLFHMAFGSILGVSAWTRGQERVQAIKSGVNPDGDDLASTNKVT